MLNPGDKCISIVTVNMYLPLVQISKRVVPHIDNMQFYRPVREKLELDEHDPSKIRPKSLNTGYRKGSHIRYDKRPITFISFYCSMQPLSVSSSSDSGNGNGNG